MKRALFRWFFRQRIGWVTVSFCLVFVLRFSLFAQSKIELYGSRTVDVRGESVRLFVPHLNDTIAWDTIYQVGAAGGFPVSYYRKIQEPVCFDNKCRMLNIVIHWNVTGRYLGFELPTGEYLSKAEHEPFVFAEYERMHCILSDPFSPLAGIAYNELVPIKNTAPAAVDAVSSPTAKNLLAFVVEGAAFTTYKLWHIVHGPTSVEVSRHTEHQLTADLWLQIANSNDVFDRIWALEHRAALRQSNETIRQLLLTSIIDGRYNVANSAIAAVGQEDFHGQGFQEGMVEALDSVNGSLRKSIVIKLGEASELDPEAVDELTMRLPTLSGELVATILKLFVEKNVQSDEVNRRVARLLRNPNRFISRQAYDYFQKLGVEDSGVLKEIRNYEKKHGRN